MTPLLCAICHKPVHQPRPGRILFPDYNALKIEGKAVYFHNSHTREELQRAVKEMQGAA